MTQLEYITDLLIDFDEMSFAPTTLCSDPEAYAIEWRQKLTNAISLYASELIEDIEKYILEGASTIKSTNSDAMYGAKFAIENVVLPLLEAFKKKYTEERK